MHLDARPNYARNVIYPFRIFTISCNKLHATIHDQTTHGTLFILSEYSRFRATSCTLRSTTKPRTERYLSFPNIHDFVQQVARYDPRSTHARNEIKRGDFCVSFFKQHIINHQERYSFRATSCTLRFPVSCIKMHATIQDFVQQVARYDSGVDTNRGDVPDVARTL